MAKPSVVTKQTDFSAGELDINAKRSDDLKILKSGARQASNWRVLNSQGVTNRPGRRVLFLDGPRVDEVLMSPGNKFYIVFGNLYLRVYNAAGTKVFESGAVMPWTTATAANVVWDIYKYSIYMTFSGMRPKVLTWDGVSQSSTWALAAYTEDVSGAQKRTPFYRVTAPGITVLPSASEPGPITLTFSSPIVVAGLVGTRIRYINSQILITGVTNTSVATATVEERLRSADQLVFAPGTLVSTFYNVNDEVIGQTSGSKGFVTAVNDQPAAPFITVQRTVPIQFIAPETIVGPHGALPITAFVAIPPQAVAVWDDEVMNDYRGYPRSCFVDQGRLGFCDFPSVPGFIAWSAFGVFTDQYTDDLNALPTSAIQEIVPSKSQVLYVMAGMDSSEFVFCDNTLYYIPITQANPLKPGSVAFNQLTMDGAAQVKPQRAQQSIVYVGAGLQQIKAIQAIGAYSRPYIVDDISELHSHFLSTPAVLAIPSATSQFEERYIYVMNADGSLAVGKYRIKNGLIDTETMGWLPWSGGGTATWISQLNNDMLICGTYAPNSIAPVSIVEAMDDTQYLDAAMLYNAAPAALTPPGGKGPLWWLAGGTVDLMDGPLGTRMMGTYTIDANGFLVPQNNGGEDLTSVHLVVGQAWTAILEPFIPAAQVGQDVGQRMWPRRLKGVCVRVQASSGFVMARLFGGIGTATSPAAGTIMRERRIPTWNQDDDPTQPPPLREQAYRDRPVGYSDDPRWAIIKDTPGPLTILEIDTEVSV